VLFFPAKCSSLLLLVATKGTAVSMLETLKKMELRREGGAWKMVSGI
jgi:hypothetical protein